jgi:hypothetical protein
MWDNGRCGEVTADAITTAAPTTVTTAADAITTAAPTTTTTAADVITTAAPTGAEV